MNGYKTCLKCGTIHFEMSRKEAEKAVAVFNEFYDKLPTKDKETYYGNRNSKLSDYEHCTRCGASYKQFRDTTKGDGPEMGGFTVNPILSSDDS